MSAWLILAYSTGENPPTSTLIFVIHIVPRKIIHLLKQFVELCLPISLESWSYQPDLYHALLPTEYLSQIRRQFWLFASGKDRTSRGSGVIKDILPHNEIRGSCSHGAASS